MPETTISENLVGRTFGRVTILEFHSEPQPNRRYWKCECKCGKIRVLREDAIKALPTCRQCRSNDIAHATGPKTCFKCGETKQRADFHKNNATADGLNGCCKECNAAMAANQYNKMRKRANIVVPESKTCSQCRITKRSDQFWINKGSRDGLHSWCSECAGACAKNWHKTVAMKDPNRLNKARAGRFGISLEELLKMLAVQENRCAICKEEFTKSSNWVIDHCHKTNKIRGLLCRTCNTSLGGFKDSIENLKAAIAYLESC